MTEPAHPGRLPAARTDWALVHPLLAALTRAGIPVGPGDLDQLQNAAALGPEFVHALARWIHEAHTAAPPSANWAAVARTPVPGAAKAPQPGHRESPPALASPRPARQDCRQRQAS
ncbi:hypothetical protein OG871_35295 [Kitasatospora sp. NBC_00374]|uniref:hypothetical protein n=1 Tax=Kitasatospora sp. NBC_00374 TaxID=2975964 RepID=UPI0030DFDF65